MIEDRRRRTLLIVLIAAGALVVVGVIALVMLLAQGGPSAEPTPAPAATSETPTPSSTPTPSPSPTPTATAEAGGELVLGAEGFSLTPTGGEGVWFRWSDEPGEVVAALTAAFGSEPVEGLQEGDGSHFPDYTVWTWPGLDYASMIETPGNKTREEYAAPAWVEFTANRVGEVEVSAEFGLAIGMSADDVRAAGPDEEYPSPYRDGPRFLFALDRSIHPSDDEPRRVSVMVDADEDAGVAMIGYRYSSWGL